MIIKKSKSFKKRAAVVIVVLALLMGSFLYALYFNGNDESIRRDADGVSIERTNQDRQLEEEINNNPEQKKQRTQTDLPTEPAIDQQTQLQMANVVMTNARLQADKVNASGFVSNVVEENGSCKFVFSKDGTIIEKQSGTLTNASSTTCRTVEFDKNELSPGTWIVYIEYLSSFSSGESNKIELSVR